MSRFVVSTFAAVAALAALTAGARGGAPSRRAIVPPVAIATFPPATREKLDMAITTWLGTSKAPGVVVGLWFPGGTYVVARGSSDASTGAPMVVANRFRIGDITTTFTVTVLLELAGAKKVGLDDPVSKYVSYVPNGRHITLRMLAAMTSGLFNYSDDASFRQKVQADPKAPWKPRELLNVAFAHKPAFAPGTGWQYSNTNAVLLGLIIEAVTHRKIQDVFAEKLYRPLGLKQTSWPAGTALPPPYASGVTEQTADGAKTDATNWNPSWGFAAAALISTLSDLRVWVRSYTTGSLISPAMQKQRLTWVTLPPNTPARKYAMGIGSDSGWLGQSGEVPGYNSGGYYLPSRDATIVILVNSDIPIGKDNPMQALFRAIAQLLTPGNVPN